MVLLQSNLEYHFSSLAVDRILLATLLGSMQLSWNKLKVPPKKSIATRYETIESKKMGIERCFYRRIICVLRYNRLRMIKLQ